MKDTPFQYIETILTTVAEKGTLNNVFDRSIETWTQSTSFVDAFTLLALNSLGFRRHVANIVKTCTEKTAKEWRKPANVKAVPPPDRSDPWLQPPSLLLSIDEEARKKHCPARRRNQATRANYFEKSQVYQDRYSSARCDRGLNFLSKGHQTLLSDLVQQPNADGVPLQSLLPASRRWIPILPTMTRFGIRAVDYRTFQLTNYSARYDETVSCYITKIVKNVEMEMKAHFLDPSSLISIIGFYTTSKFV